MPAPVKFVAVYLLAALLAFLSLVTSAALNYFAWYDNHFVGGVFQYNQSYYWDRYDSCLTTSSWVFYVGAAVWIGQALWIFFSVTLICSQQDEVSLFHNPPIHPTLVLFFFAITMLSTIGWLFLWVNDTMVKFASLLVLVGALCSYACLTLSVYRVHQYQKQLVEMGLGCSVWVIRILVHNGLAALATYLSILLFYNLAAVLIQDAGVNPLTACYINLGLTAAYTIVFFAVDILSCTVTRWTYTAPYLILVIFEGAIIIQNHDALETGEKAVLICASVLLGMTGTMLFVRMAVSIWRYKIMKKLSAAMKSHYEGSMLRKPRESSISPDNPIPEEHGGTMKSNYTSSIQRSTLRK